MLGIMAMAMAGDSLKIIKTADYGINLQEIMQMGGEAKGDCSAFVDAVYDALKGGCLPIIYDNGANVNLIPSAVNGYQVVFSSTGSMRIGGETQYIKADVIVTNDGVKMFVTTLT